MLPDNLRAKKGSALTFDELDSHAATPVDQVGHGFAVGQLVRWTAIDACALAQANSASTLAEGVVVFVESADRFWIATQDGTPYRQVGHGEGPGVLYLSKTVAGGTQTTAPAIAQPVGRIIDDDHKLFRLGFIAN